MLGLLGTLLAWAVAATELGSALHFAVISHEICGEHGELVHADDHAGDHHAEHDHKATSVSNGASEHAHEHCAAFARPDDKAVVATPPSIEIVAPLAHAVAWQPSSAPVVVTQSTRLLAAPKTSPPA